MTGPGSPSLDPPALFGSSFRIRNWRGAVAFLLFLLPKLSVKPNSVRQTDPRTFLLHFLSGRLVCPVLFRLSSHQRIWRASGRYQGMHSGHVQATDTNTKARMIMDTKVAKITRSLTSWVISSPIPLRGDMKLASSRPSPSRRSERRLLIVLMAFAGSSRHPRTLSVFASKPGRPDGRHHIPLLGNIF